MRRTPLEDFVVIVSTLSGLAMYELGFRSEAGYIAGIGAGVVLGGLLRSRRGPLDNRDRTDLF